MGEIYISKNVKVRAIQFTRQNLKRIQEFAGNKISNIVGTDEPSGNFWPVPLSCTVDTFEGKTTASAGDWIIRGTHGEFYPCKHAVFIERYNKHGFANLTEEHLGMIRELVKQHSGVSAVVVDKFGIQVLNRDEKGLWALETLDLEGTGIDLSVLPKDVPIYITEDI